ncbi:MAG: hydrogenase maturation nickel metallochaperone HypA [Ignavibacteriales bacterium]
MHEYAVAESIVRLAEDQAKKHNAQKVIQINLVIGEMAGIEPESLRMYFELLAEGTIVQSAKLNFTYISAQFKCEKCNEIYAKVKSAIECPLCGSFGRMTEKGKEFYMESIEVD